MDADKEGFLRDQRSLVQTVGRAARNINGLVIMYADKITKSMEITIEETARRRTMQIEYNEQHGLVPTALNKSKESILESTTVATTDEQLHTAYYKDQQATLLAAEPILEYQTKAQLEEKIRQIKSKMQKAAKEMDFLEAARWRDALQKLEQL